MKLLGFRSGKKWKKILASILYGFIALIVLTAIFGNDDSTSKETTKETTAKVSEKKESPNKEKPKAELIGLNQPLKVGKVVFIVKSVSTSDNVGGEFGSNAQGKYIILDIIVKNEGKEALTVLDSFFTLTSNGAKYESDTNANIFANEAGKSFFVQEINPGIEAKGKIVFDVTEEVIKDQNKVLNVQTGVFGTEKGKIKLK